jgi:hypothetical protein
MPKELVAIAPRTPVLREYEEPVLGERQVRIRAELASPKHGSISSATGTNRRPTVPMTRSWAR